MMEKSDTGECHGYTILVAGIYDMVVTHTASCLRYVLHSTLVGTLHIVTEGEEGITSQTYTRIRAIQALFSSLVRGSGRSVKNFCHSPSARTSI